MGQDQSAPRQDTRGVVSYDTYDYDASIRSEERRRGGRTTAALERESQHAASSSAQQRRWTATDPFSESETAQRMSASFPRSRTPPELLRSGSAASSRSTRYSIEDEPAEHDATDDSDVTHSTPVRGVQARGAPRRSGSEANVNLRAGGDRVTSSAGSGTGAGSRSAQVVRSQRRVRAQASPRHSFAVAGWMPYGGARQLSVPTVSRIRAPVRAASPRIQSSPYVQRTPRNSVPGPEELFNQPVVIVGDDGTRKDATAFFAQSRLGTTIRHTIWGRLQNMGGTSAVVTQVNGRQMAILLRDRDDQVLHQTALDAQQVVKYFLKDDQSAQLLAEITRIQQELSSSEENAVELQVQLDEARHQHAKALEETERLQQKLIEARATATVGDDGDGDGDGIDPMAEERIQQALARCAELEAQLAEQRNTVEELREERAQLEDQLGQGNSATSELRERYAVLEEQLNEAQNQLELQQISSSTGVDALQLQLDAAQQETVALQAAHEAQLADLRAQNASDLEEERSRSTAALASATEELSSKQYRILELERKLESSLSQLEENQQNAELSQSELVNKMDTQLREERDRVEALAESLRELEHAHDVEITQQREKATVAQREAAEQAEQLRTALSAAEQDRDSLLVRQTEQQRELEALQASLHERELTLREAEEVGELARAEAQQVREDLQQVREDLAEQREATRLESERLHKERRALEAEQALLLEKSQKDSRRLAKETELLRAQEDRASEAEHRNAHLERELREREEKTLALEASLAALTAQLERNRHATEKALAEQRSLARESQQQIEGHAMRVTALTRELEEVQIAHKTTVDTLEHQIAVLSKDRSDVSAVDELHKQELNQLRAEMTAMRNARLKAEDDLSLVRNDLERIQVEHEQSELALRAEREESEKALRGELAAALAAHEEAARLAEDAARREAARLQVLQQLLVEQTDLGEELSTKNAQLHERVVDLEAQLAELMALLSATKEDADAKAKQAEVEAARAREAQRVAALEADRVREEALALKTAQDLADEQRRQLQSVDPLQPLEDVELVRVEGLTQDASVFSNGSVAQLAVGVAQAEKMRHDLLVRRNNLATNLNSFSGELVTEMKAAAEVEEQANALAADSRDGSLQAACDVLSEGLESVSETMTMWREERDRLAQWQARLAAEKEQVTAEISRAKGGIVRSGSNSKTSIEDKLNALYQRQSTIDFHESRLRELEACRTSAEQWEAVRSSFADKLEIHFQRVNDTMAALASHADLGDHHVPSFESSSARFTLINEMERLASRQSSISQAMKEAQTELVSSLEDFTEVLSESTELETAKNSLQEAMSRMADPEADQQKVAQLVQERYNELVEALRAETGDLSELSEELDALEEKMDNLLDTLAEFAECTRRRQALLEKLFTGDAIQARAAQDHLRPESAKLTNELRRLRAFLDQHGKVMEKLRALREQHEVQYVPGDEVDRMVTEVLDEIRESDMPIPGNFGRISEGFYQFGTRKIRAQILSGSLVVRVGGGFMTFLEFVQKYGRLESVKVVRATGDQQGATTVVRRGSTLSTVSSQGALGVHQRSGRAGRSATSSSSSASSGSSSSSSISSSSSATPQPSSPQVQGRRRRDASSSTTTAAAAAAAAASSSSSSSTSIRRKPGSRIDSRRASVSAVTTSDSPSSSSTGSRISSRVSAASSSSTDSLSSRRSLSRKPIASSSDRLVLPGEGSSRNKMRVGSIRRSHSSERGLNHEIKRSSTSDAHLGSGPSDRDKRTTAPPTQNTHRRSHSSVDLDLGNP